jgi:hypothetical protein
VGASGATGGNAVEAAYACLTWFHFEDEEWVDEYVLDCLFHVQNPYLSHTVHHPQESSHYLLVKLYITAHKRKLPSYQQENLLHQNN